MHPNKLRAFWAARQGLLECDTHLSPETVLEQTGWARSVGGVGPYLTLFTRAGLTRPAIDRAVAQLQIHELPSARGCTYVVPRSDFALALRCSQGFGDAAEVQTAKKHLGVTDAELDRLGRNVLDALAGGALDPAALKDRLGDLVRNLGPEGKKRGVTTTLPLVLGSLQTAGEIRRQPIGGRLDQQRYAYARWADSPLPEFTLDAAAADVELARHFFRWSGPASLAHFQAFSGLGVKASKAAVAPLGLLPVSADSPLLALPEDLDALRAFVPPETPVYRLVASVDALLLLRRDLALLLDPADVPRVQQIGGLQDLPSHAIVDRGRLVGLWEYDPEREDIAWTSFVRPDAALRAEVERTAAMIREHLGDARSFSLDSPESRKPRIAALRAG
ncbi:DNA glycosylase AlkZ-like family protein [Nannocystis radixulma]|uniref:Crosslink repair DNA glycosylase YcaQ family protein n=1 Tax=Nannocystis radixulma TaxID=2995305 RepID=A0ABT5BBP3_9BACT|nr:crosslink repair DNA glycosylase YcaQ family protein [Nannocystis radixulma]MDC0671554.1 crosslink repair DNA glycosylase YcaQ family protein [Nannocystis radixulma]